jgi:pyrimidine operon attenuation protein/uracil phosphoribosyltransferase
VTDLNVESLIDHLATALAPYFSSESPPIIIGIETGGYWTAEELHRKLQPDTELGKLNITFYRDDFTKIGLHPTVKPSRLPTDVSGRTIILVDDVIHSGRTIRAAMNEIFDYGRPEKIILAALIDRGERELPIQPDVIAHTLELKPGEHIKLEGPSPLKFSIQRMTQ